MSKNEVVLPLQLLTFAHLWHIIKYNLKYLEMKQFLDTLQNWNASSGPFRDWIESIQIDTAHLNASNLSSSLSTSDALSGNKRCHFSLSLKS